jgi:hypothetical protein
VSTAAVRVCTKHNAVAFVDDRRDRVVCPEDGGHRLREGQWTVRTAGEAGGDALLMAEARRALRAQEDQHAAVEALLAAASINTRLRHALLEDAATRAIARAAGRAVPELIAPPAKAARRETVARTPAPPARPRSDGDNGLQLMASSNLRDLLSITIRGGVQLRDAYGSTVLGEADEAAAMARGGAIRARWLRLIAARVPSGRTVGQVLDEGMVQRLHHQAEAELAAVLRSVSKRLTRVEGLRAGLGAAE